MSSDTNFKLQTKATRTYNDGQKRQRPLSVPILRGVNFEAHSSRQLGRDFRSHSDMVYQRFGHPTSSAAAEKIALLEGAEAGLVFSSGMGAISTTLMALVGSMPAHIVAQREIFAQTFTFLDKTLRALGVETTFVNVADLRELRDAIRTTTKLVYIESPSNPLLRIADISAIATIANEHKIPLLIDSTFASPYLQNPLALGASVVLHSATKFLAGHSDVMCGAAVGSREFIAKIDGMQRLLGSVLDPGASWLLLRGIKSLGVRVQRQSDSALAIAKFLRADDKIASVAYPFLEGSPYYRTAVQQMRGGGGVISFEVKGGYEAATKFVDALQLISVATSLGGVESVIEIPFDLDWGEDQLGAAAQHAGIPTGLIRLSVGIEDLDDLMEDVRRGLHAVRSESEALTLEQDSFVKPEEEKIY